MEEPPLRREGRFWPAAFPCLPFLSPVPVLAPAPDLAFRGLVPAPVAPFLSLARYVLCLCLYRVAPVLASFGRDRAPVHVHDLEFHAPCLYLWCQVRILGSALAQATETRGSGPPVGKMLTLLLMMMLLGLLSSL